MAGLLPFLSILAETAHLHAKVLREKCRTGASREALRQVQQMEAVGGWRVVWPNDFNNLLMSSAAMPRFRSLTPA